MSYKNTVLGTWLFLIFVQVSDAGYSFKVTVKYPFASQRYDTMGNVISDSLVRFRAITPIIYRSETESLCYESATNDSGYALFTFDNWQDNTPVSLENITRMAIDFPRTHKVIEVNGKITFEPLRYSDIDFRRSPGEIEIVLPLTVYKDSFAIGSPSWTNVCNIAVMNDMHIGAGFYDFETAGWNDQDNGMDGNYVTWNNHNVVVAINALNPDFVVVLGDITESGEKSEFQRARGTGILGNLQQKPYIPILGNHDIWPYIKYFPGITGDEANIPEDCFLGQYFYEGFATMYDSAVSFFANWQNAPELSFSPDNRSYYLNFSFDHQNYKFIGCDFNSRNSGFWLGVPGEADVHPWSLNWLESSATVATNEKRKLFILGHHPLLNRRECCFGAHEIHLISVAGLKNNKPAARWIGGHVHGHWFPPQKIDTTYSGDDTVAIVFTLNNACMDGVYGWVSIYDKLFARIWHPPYDPWYRALPVTVDFQTLYSYIGSENAFGSSSWDFGDGGTSSLKNPTHVYHLWNDFHKTFKVTLTVTAANGQKVSTSKRIKVIASPYSPSIVFAKENILMMELQEECSMGTGFMQKRPDI